MNDEKKKPIFDLLNKWECPVDWDDGIAAARHKLESLLENETEQYAKFLDEQFCHQVKATAEMALNWIFYEDEYSVLCYFSTESGPRRFDGPLSIVMSVGMDGQYRKQTPLDQMIAEEVDGHLGQGMRAGDKTESRAFLDKILAILAEYETRDDWSYKEFERLKDLRKNGQGELDEG